MGGAGRNPYRGGAPSSAAMAAVAVRASGGAVLVDVVVNPGAGGRGGRRAPPRRGGSERGAPSFPRGTPPRPDVVRTTRVRSRVPTQDGRDRRRVPGRGPPRPRRGGGMMDYQALHDDLARVLEDLIEKNHTVPVLVEEERDVRALRALGVSGDLRVVNRGTTLFAVCEEVAREHGDAIILTDWDVRGGGGAPAPRR